MFHYNKCDIIIGARAKQLAADLRDGKVLKCAICGVILSSLLGHVKREHNVTKSEYTEKYGPLLAPASREKYSKSAVINGSWIARANENGEDLSEYWKKVSLGVSSAIMASPKERERRAKMLGDLNKTDQFRKKASDTAKITSARQDVQDARSLQLKNWRDNNPEDFYNQCTAKMHTYKSRPESALFDIIRKRYLDLDFKNNQFIQDAEYFTLTKSNRKQVDIISGDGKIAIEFDGHHHFESVWDPKVMLTARKKDVQLSQYCLDNKITLIRVAKDCYTYRDDGSFHQRYLDKINEIITNPTYGVHFIGSSYNDSEYSRLTKIANVVALYYKLTELHNLKELKQ